MEHSIKKPVPELTRENHEQWCRLMKLWLMQKDAAWTLSVIPTVTPVSTPEGTTTPSGQSTLEYSIHSPTFEKCNAIALYWITLCIAPDDQLLIQEEDKAKRAWELLENKYKSKLKVTGRSLLAEYVNYTMTEGVTISSAWVHLASLGRQITAVSPELQEFRQPSRRLQQLLSALPPSWESIRDSIDTQPHLSVDQALAMLQEKEARLANTEHGMAAFQKGQSNSGKPPLTCYLCEGVHTLKDCPDLREARRAIRKKKHSTKTSSPSESTKSLLANLVKRLEKLEAPQKARAYAAAEEEQSPSPPPEVLSSDEEVETAHAAAELKGDHSSP